MVKLFRNNLNTNQQIFTLIYRCIWLKLNQSSKDEVSANVASTSPGCKSS